MCFAKTQVLQKLKSGNQYILLQLLLNFCLTAFKCSCSHHMSLPNLFGRCRGCCQHKIWVLRRFHVYPYPVNLVLL
uniref:Uncharacterized protein n=1 Tax=Populus trichocarpa TaxID=3694 RepID=U5G9N9_POPTR